MQPVRRSMDVTVQRRQKWLPLPPIVVRLSTAGAKEPIVKTLIIKRSIAVAGRMTSISLEEEFWKALEDIARDHGVAQSALLSGIRRCHSGNFSSATRVFMLEYYRERVPITAKGRSKERSRSRSATAARADREVPAHG
jgi:predicted DNA-binding ribbon-helix-helix protein